MKLQHWPFIFLKRNKDDYSAAPSLPSTPEFEFALLVFKDSPDVVYKAWEENPSVAQDLANQMFTLNKLTGMTATDMGLHIAANPDNWIADLATALQAALNPNPISPPSTPTAPSTTTTATGPGAVLQAVEDFGPAPGQGSVYTAALDIAAGLSGADPISPSVSVGVATTVAAVSSVVDVDNLSAVVASGVSESTAGVDVDAAPVPVAPASGDAEARATANNIANQIANDYGLSRAQERSLASVLFKNPSISQLAVETFIADNPSTWQRDIFIFEVAGEFSLTDSQTNKLIAVMRANSGWVAEDLRAYLQTVSPTDYDHVLNQASTAVQVAATNGMTTTQSQQLTAAMVSNASFNAENVQEFIDSNPTSWNRVLEVNDYISSLPNLTETEKNSLITLANENPEWTKDYVENLVTTNAAGWKAVVAEQVLFEANDLSTSQQTMVQSFLEKNSQVTPADVQVYIDAHPETWERDLVRWDAARDISDDNQFNAEQRSQLERYMIKNHNISVATIESGITTDKPSFLRGLIVFDVAEQYSFSADQRTILDQILKTNPAWTAADLKAYIAAHPTDWDDDLNQVGNASILTDKHDLSATQQQLLGAYLLSDYRVDVNALDEMIEDDPAAFEALMDKVSVAHEVATSLNFTDVQAEQLIRVMTSGPNFTEAEVRGYFAASPEDWATKLQQIDGTWLVAAHLQLSAADRAIVEKLMMADPRNTSGGVAHFIQTNPTTWRNEFKISELIIRNRLSENEATQLKAFLQRYATEWTVETVDAYITANPNTWRLDLKFNTATNVVNGFADAHGLTVEDKQLLTVWLASNPRMTQAEVEALIAANPTGWKQSLVQIKDALDFATAQNLSQEEKDAIVRIMAADPSIKIADISAIVTSSPDHWRGHFQRIDGAIAISELLDLNAADSALVRRGMTMFSELDFNGMASFIQANEADWQTKLQQIFDELAAAANPIGRQVEGGIQVTAGNSLTPARVEWVHAVSFADFKNNFDFNDRQYWTEKAVGTGEFQYAGKDSVPVEITENRLAPPTVEELEAIYIRLHGSPLEKINGRLHGTYSLISYDTKDGGAYRGGDRITRQTQQQVDFSVDPNQITGDSRNKDIVWTGDFNGRLQVFNENINGVNYRDVDAATVATLDSATYMARQLSDFAKASGFSYENPSGDNAIQLGVYLDTLGMKDINHLYVKDGRYVDISTGRDLGAYQEGQPFAYSAFGKGWNDFMPNVLPSGQCVLIPKWGSTSDLGTIVMVIAVVAACFTAGASLAVSGAAAGTAGASIATSVGGAMLSGVGLTTATLSGLGLSATAIAGVSAGLGIATITTGVKLLAGESMSIGDVAKSLVIGTASGWAGGQFLNAVGGATAGGALAEGGLASTLYAAGAQSVGSTLFSNAVQGESLTAGLGQNLTTSLLGAGIGYGVNSLNANVLGDALNAQQVSVASNVLTTAALGGSALDVGAAVFRGLTVSPGANDRANNGQGSPYSLTSGNGGNNGLQIGGTGSVGLGDNNNNSVRLGGDGTSLPATTSPYDITAGIDFNPSGGFHNPNIIVVSQDANSGTNSIFSITNTAQIPTGSVLPASLTLSSLTNSGVQFNYQLGNGTETGNGIYNQNQTSTPLGGSNTDNLDSTNGSTSPYNLTSGPVTLGMNSQNPMARATAFNISNPTAGLTSTLSADGSRVEFTHFNGTVAGTLEVDEWGMKTGTVKVGENVEVVYSVVDGKQIQRTSVISNQQSGQATHFELNEDSQLMTATFEVNGQPRTVDVTNTSSGYTREVIENGTQQKFTYSDGSVVIMDLSGKVISGTLTTLSGVVTYEGDFARTALHSGGSVSENRITGEKITTIGDSTLAFTPGVGTVETNLSHVVKRDLEGNVLSVEPRTIAGSVAGINFDTTGKVTGGTGEYTVERTLTSGTKVQVHIEVVDGAVTEKWSTGEIQRVNAAGTEREFVSGNTIRKEVDVMLADGATRTDVSVSRTAGNGLTVVHRGTLVAAEEDGVKTFVASGMELQGANNYRDAHAFYTRNPQFLDSKGNFTWNGQSYRGINADQMYKPEVLSEVGKHFNVSGSQVTADHVNQYRTYMQDLNRSNAVRYLRTYDSQLDHYNNYLQRFEASQPLNVPPVFSPEENNLNMSVSSGNSRQPLSFSDWQIDMTIEANLQAQRQTMITEGAAKFQQDALNRIPSYVTVTDELTGISTQIELTVQQRIDQAATGLGVSAANPIDAFGRLWNWAQSAGVLNKIPGVALVSYAQEKGWIPKFTPTEVSVMQMAYADAASSTGDLATSTFGQMQMAWSLATAPLNPWVAATVAAMYNTGSAVGGPEASVEAGVTSFVLDSVFNIAGGPVLGALGRGLSRLPGSNQVFDAITHNAQLFGDSSVLRASDILPSSSTYKALNSVAGDLPVSQMNQFNSAITGLANSRTVSEFQVFGSTITHNIDALRTAGFEMGDIDYLKFAARDEFVTTANNLFSPADAQRLIGDLDAQLGYKAVDVPDAYRTWYQAVGRTGPNAISLEANFARDLNLFQSNPSMLQAGDPNLFLVFQRSVSELPSTGSLTGSITTPPVGTLTGTGSTGVIADSGVNPNGTGVIADSGVNPNGTGVIADSGVNPSTSTPELFARIENSVGYDSALNLNHTVKINGSTVSSGGFRVASDTLYEVKELIDQGGAAALAEARTYLSGVKTQMQNISDLADDFSQQSVFAKSIDESNSFSNVYTNLDGRTKITVLDHTSNSIRIDIDIVDGSNSRSLKLFLQGDDINRSIDSIVSEVKAGLQADASKAKAIVAEVDTLLARSDFDSLHVPGSGTVENGGGVTTPIADDPYVSRNDRGPDATVGNFNSASIAGARFETELRGFQGETDSYKSVFKNSSGEEIGRIEFNINGNEMAIEDVFVPEALRQNGINTNMVRDLLSQHPNVTTIKASNFNEVNMQRYTDAYDAARAAGKSPQEAMRLGIESTPAYHFRLSLGFTELEFNPLLTGTPEFIMRKPSTGNVVGAVGSNEISNVPGMGFQRLENEIINGQDAFIKVTHLKENGQMNPGVSRQASDVANEIEMAQTLGDLGLAPRFLGTRISHDGYVSIITKNEPGFHIDSRLAIRPDHVTQQHLESIMELANRVDGLGLDGRDIQFRLTTDGRAVLVDTEGFSLSAAGSRGDVGNTLREMASGLVVDKIVAKFESPAYASLGLARIDATDLLRDASSLNRTQRFEFLQRVEALNESETLELMNSIAAASNSGGATAVRTVVSDWFHRSPAPNVGSSNPANMDITPGEIRSNFFDEINAFNLNPNGTQSSINSPSQLFQRTPNETVARVERDLDSARDWNDLVARRESVMESITEKYRIERVPSSHPELAGKNLGAAVGQDVIYVLDTLSPTRAYSVILHELNHLQLNPQGTNLFVKSTSGSLGGGRSYVDGFRTDEIKSSTIDFASNAQTVASAIKNADLNSVVDESLMIMENSLRRREEFIANTQLALNDAMSSGISVDGLRHVGSPTINSTRNGVTTGTQVDRWIFEIPSRSLSDHPIYFEFTTRRGASAADAIESLKTTAREELSTLEFARVRLADDQAYLSELQLRVERSRSNQGVVAEDVSAEMSPEDFQSYFGNTDRLMNMNANPVANALSPNTYQADFNLNPYFRGIDNPFEHRAFFNGSPVSSGGVSVAADSLREAGRFLNANDGVQAVSAASVALQELSNIQKGFDEIVLLNHSRFSFDTAQSVGGNQVYKMNNQSQIEIREITGADGQRISLVSVSVESNGLRNLYQVEVNRVDLSIADAVSALKNQVAESNPVVNQMIHDAKAVIEVGRLDNVIGATPISMAENRIASEFLANQNLVGAGNIVNGNIPGQGQIAIGDASRGSQIRLNRQVADVNDLGDGFFVAGIDGQTAGITRQEIGVHFQDVVDARTANGISPQLMGTKDVNFTDGYSGGDQMVYRTEVEGNTASIRGFLQGYIDSMALGDRITAGRIIAELPVLLRQTRGLNEGFIKIDQSALSADGQSLIAASLRTDPSAAVLNDGFKRYSYEIPGEGGQVIKMSVEVPSGATQTEVIRMIKIQHETGLNVGLSVKANLVSLENQVQAVINHADVRGIDAIRIDYAEGFSPNASNTGDRVMNMNSPIPSSGAVGEGESILSMLLRRDASTLSRNADPVDAGTVGNVTSISSSKSPLELLDEGREQYRAISANRESNPMDRLIAKQRVDQLERDAIPAAAALDDGQDFLKLLQKDFKPSDASNQIANTFPASSAAEIEQMSRRATEMVRRGETNELEILFTQNRLSKSAQEIVDDLCRQALGPSVAEQNRIIAIKGLLDGKSALQVTISPELRALDRELFAIERKYRPFNQDELKIFEAVSEVPKDTITLSRSELKWIEDIRKLIYGPETKTQLFPSDVEALAKVNDLIDQVAANRTAVISDAQFELRALNGSTRSYLDRLPSNVEDDFKRAFGRTQRIYNIGSGEQVDVLDVFKTILTRNPESAIRHENYRWASTFFHTNIASQSGALRNTFEGNSSMQYIYDRFIQLERINEIDRLNVSSNALPDKI